MKILLADAGATKTDWVALTLSDGSESKDSSGCRLDSYSGVGISPLHHDADMIAEELRLVRASLGESFDRIRFYGAGIGTPVIAGKMEAMLSEMFSCRDIKADSDMSGAACAVLGSEPGIACIMGTGSNSCHYDGKAIDRKSASLGYLLDDEGGGVAYCRRFLSDVYKGIAPEDIITEFNNAYSLSVSDVVDHLYRRQSPNRWIAGFMPFIVDHLDHSYVSSLVESQTESFFDREFHSYSQSELNGQGIGFVGSVAEQLKPFIKSSMERRGWRLRDIVGNPIDSLINIHKYDK